MDATTIPEPPGFSELSATEQVRYIQMLWDRISERLDELPVRESYFQLVKERLGTYLRDPRRARSAYEIIADLSARV